MEVTEDKWINRNALVTAIMQDVSPYMQDDTLCDRLNPESDLLGVASKALLGSLFKKWEPECNSVQAETRALLTFLEANRLSETWSFCAETDRDYLFLETVKGEIDRFLHIGPDLLVDSFSAMLEEGDVGPGSSVGSRGESFYAKLCASPLTTTSLPLYEVYSAYVSMFPTFADAESVRRANYGSVTIVDGSQVSFAPKNVETARLICVEPSLNMFMQLGLKTILEKRLSYLWGIDVKTQPEMNRLLARLGSRDGSYATLDLKSASDLVSLNLCKLIFPEWFYNLLMDLRSPRANVRQYGLKRDLGMLSTMGDGFTFPVMTMVLAAVVRATYKVNGIAIKANLRPKVRLEPHDWPYESGSFNDPSRMRPGNWGVFGDDLICVHEVYADLCRFLGLLGFQVNVEKSFNEGPFRESCGHDYFRGVNIRGVYLKRLSSRQDITVAVNLLNEWTARTGISLRSAVTYLLGFLPNPYLVPYVDPIDSGIRVPSSHWSGTRKSQKVYYKAYLKRPKRITFLENGTVQTPRGSRKLVYNGHGCLLALLRGELRNGRITTRQNSRGLYQTRWCVTPNWDYMPASVWVNPQTDWRRFETAVALNMGHPEA
jgi:hypothetical protein